MTTIKEGIWGLIFIGLVLVLGLFTRIASGSGAFLLLLCYVANPPFIGLIGETTGEGQYLIINKTLIEMAILLLLVFLLSPFTFGIDRLAKRATAKFRSEKSKVNGKEDELTFNQGRRELLKDLISLPIVEGFAYLALKKKQWESFEER